MDIKIDNSFEEEANKKNFNFKGLIIIVSCFILMICLIIVYARYKATSGLVIKEYKVVDSNLPSTFHGFKVVQFSDLYFGNTVNLKYLDKIVSEINSLNPDIVVFTGDLMGSDTTFKDEIISSLKSIKAKYGKYGIKGDRDGELYDSIMSSSDFVDITNSSMDVYNNKNEKIFLVNDDSLFDGYTVYLIHKPDDVDGLNNNYNLILAGHSLGGQVNLPFVRNIFLQEGSKKYYNGFYKEKNLYVSSGIGTTNFKYRFLNKPSINLYRLCNK